MAFYYGTNNNDVLLGSNSNDTFWTYNGNDIAWGYDGKDTMYGGNNIDWLFGGADDDKIYGNAGEDWLAGDDGNDTINGGTGNDSMEGNDGNDTFYVHDVGDVVVELSGVNSGTDKVVSYIDGYDLPDNVENLEVRAGQANHWTANGNDLDNEITLFASFQTSRIIVQSGGGNDTVSGNRQRDLIFGQSGQDLLQGRAGNDALDGGLNNDTLEGGNNNDTLRGGSGNDVLMGGGGDDLLSGNTTIISEGNGGFPHWDMDHLWGEGGDDIFEIDSIYAQGFGYALIYDFSQLNGNRDTIRLVGDQSQYSLGTGDYERDGLSDDTAIFYGGQSQNNIIGVIANKVGLSLNDSFFEYIE